MYFKYLFIMNLKVFIPWRILINFLFLLGAYFLPFKNLAENIIFLDFNCDYRVTLRDSNELELG